MCAECGFGFDACVPEGTPAAIRVFGRRYPVLLTRGLPGEDLDPMLRARPSGGGWSALEYACHVRDVFGLYDDRIRTVLAEDRPSFPKLGRDQVAIERDYNGQDPAVVVAELSAAAEGLAARLDAVSANGWARIGIRDEWEMSVDWMARNSVHEGQHHLVDIARVLRAARGR
jgi:hypothetical protein